jgi:nucleoside-triphosphatase
MNPKITNFLLTGDPGIGKTTIIKDVLMHLNVNAQGFITQEIRSGKTRKGFQLATLDDRQAVLAHVSKKSTYKVSNYGVDIEVMTQLAVPSLIDALQSADLIVIDEIGKMECFSKEFRDCVLRCLDSPKPVLGTIQTFSSPFINTVTNRDDAVIIPVDLSNRETMAENIYMLLAELFPKTKSAAQKRKPSRRR